MSTRSKLAKNNYFTKFQQEKNTCEKTCRRKVIYWKQNVEEFEDTKGVFRIRKLKDRQHNGQTKRRTDNTMVKRKEGQTTQWPKEKGEKDKQRSTKHKTKDRVT